MAGWAHCAEASVGVARLEPGDRFEAGAGSETCRFERRSRGDGVGVDSSAARLGQAFDDVDDFAAVDTGDGLDRRERGLDQGDRVGKIRPCEAFGDGAEARWTFGMSGASQVLETVLVGHEQQGHGQILG